MRNVKQISVAKNSPDIKVFFDTGEALSVAFGNWEDADKYGIRAEAEKYWTPEAFAAQEAFSQANADRIAAEQQAQSIQGG